MTVSQWGHGRPDYYIPTISSRPQVITEENAQIKWFLNGSYTVAPVTTSINTFYTVPTGYNLSLGLIDISADNSCINKIRVVSGTDLLGEFLFDMRGYLALSSLAGQVLGEGNILTVYIYNNDSVIVNFTVTISGVLERTRK